MNFETRMLRATHIQSGNVWFLLD